MEHKLIQGGEQYLPFARSRIKALKATGLKYASQKFEIDGVSISVKLVGGEEYIRIEGGSIEIAMDSGVFNVHAIGEAAPARYFPGILYESGSALAYNQKFVFGEKPELGRTNPEKGSKGQLSGKVNKAKDFKGRILEQQAFAPIRVDAVPQTDPPTKVPSLNDDSLHYKKVTGVLCPASIFTGKCRLYVQAMYGLPLYEYDQGGNLEKTNTPMEVESSTSAAPELRLPAYVRKDKPAYQPILLSSSCGVWLDKESGRHWLMKPTNGELRVYRLISSKEGEKLRKFLIPKTGPKALNELDREHLEAYILAHSLPDVENMQIAGSVGGFGTYSMGYGWHWNWDGTRADIVTNSIFPQDNRNSAMRSTHYRITPSVLRSQNDDEDDKFSVALEVIEGPKDWAVYRTYWTITEPDYSTYTPTKTTPNATIPFECDAPFYAFYDRNELKVCRVSVRTVKATEPSRSYSPRFAGSNVPFADDVTYTTYGLGGGFIEEDTGFTAHDVVTITCGDVVAAELPFGKTRTRYKTTASTKTGFTRSSYSSTGTGAVSLRQESYPYGDPPQWTPSFFGKPDLGFWAEGITYDITSSVIYEEHSSLVAVVVPFYDSEAVYINAAKRVYGTESDKIKTSWDASIQGINYVSYLIVYEYFYEPQPGGINYHEFVGYGWNIGGGTSGAFLTATSFPTPEVTQESTTITQSLICRAGVIPATFGSVLSQFHSNEIESISAGFYTLSGASQISPVAIAYTKIVPVGAADVPPVAPVVITGWL